MAKKPFVVIDAEILSSSIWSEPPHVKLVWLTLLILCDTEGYVGASIPGIANAAGVTLQQAEDAVEKLQQPDKHSRTKSFEGRRLAPDDRGWKVLNFMEHVDRLSTERRKARERVRRWRERNAKKQESADRNVTVRPENREQRAGSREQVENGKKTALVEPDGSPIPQVFAYWQKVMEHPTSKLTGDRRRKVKARLAEGYTLDDLKAAVDGCKATAWNMGANPEGKVWDDLELICRDGKHVETFMGAASSREPVNTEAPWERYEREAREGKADA